LFDKPEYKKMLNYDPDVVFMMLGSNGWNKDDTFIEDYVDMANEIKHMKSKPDLIMMVPPPNIKKCMAEIKGADRFSIAHCIAA
jgi:hypothetical protein